MKLKQVIVVNEALKLPRGKLAAQVAHAAVGAFMVASEMTRHDWLSSGMAKVVVKAEDETELLRLYQMALERHIPARLISDAGRTVLPAGTITCLGLGPASDTEIDALTGQLNLLR